MMKNIPTLKDEFIGIFKFLLELYHIIKYYMVAKYDRINFRKYRLYSYIAYNYVVTYLVSYYRYIYGFYKIYTINKIFTLNRIEDFQLRILNKDIEEYTNHLQSYINYYKDKRSKIYNRPGYINEEYEWFLDLDLNQQEMITYFKTLNKLNLIHTLNNIVYSRLSIIQYYLGEANIVFETMYKETKRNIYY